MVMAGIFMRGYARFGRGLSTVFINFSFEDQRNGAELVRDCNYRADDDTDHHCRKNNRTEDGHAASVTGESVRMPHIVRGVMDNVDMREADHADNKQTERHGQDSLKNDASFRGGNRQ